MTVVARDLRGTARRRVGLRYPIAQEGDGCQQVWRGRICTRPRGHGGLHVAHSANNNAVMTWRAHDDFLGWLEEQEEER